MECENERKQFDEATRIEGSKMAVSEVGVGRKGSNKWKGYSWNADD